MKRISGVLVLAAGLVALLMVAIVSAAPEVPDANNLIVEPVYQGGDTDVKVGDIFTQRVRFERTAATGLLQFEIQIAKSSIRSLEKLKEIYFRIISPVYLGTVAPRNEIEEADLSHIPIVQVESLSCSLIGVHNAACFGFHCENGLRGVGE